MQIHAKPTLIILQHEPRNLKREISPNNAKHHKQEASILVSTSIVQITFITSEQRFLFWDYWDEFKQVNVGWKLATKSVKSKTTPQQSTYNLSYKYLWDNLSESDKLAHLASIYLFKINNRNARKKVWNMFTVDDKNTWMPSMT